MSVIQTWGLRMLAVVLITGGAFGQSASDLGEGLRAELTSTAGVTAIKWWGKAGRTYFVQSSATLLPDSWQYMPVVDSGAEAISSWNLQTSAERMFVRLVYTDQLYSGSASLADFDGDGLTNAQEVAANGPHSDPFVADSDWDGYSDADEALAGTGANNQQSTPNTTTATGPLNPDGRYRHGIRLDYAQKYMSASYSGYIPQMGTATHATDVYAFHSASTIQWIQPFETQTTGDTTTDLVNQYEGAGFIAHSLHLFNGYGGAWLDSNWFFSENTDSNNQNRSTQSHMNRGAMEVSAISSPGGPGWARRSMVVLLYESGVLPAFITRAGRVMISPQNLKIDPAIKDHVKPGSSKGHVVVSPRLKSTAPDEDSSPERVSWYQDLHAAVFDLDIEPDAGMAGVIGDCVPSKKPDSFVRHFVTPKLTTEIPATHVELKAGGVSAADFTTFFRWEGDGELGSASNKYKVSRSETGEGPKKVKVINKQTGATVAEMHVWVVWCDPPTVTTSTGAFGYWDVPGLGTIGRRWFCPTFWEFKYAIKPKAICDQATQERPDLSGTNRKDPPGAGTPYVVRANLFGDSATRKWDVSRQMKITVRNPSLIEQSVLRGAANGTLFDRQSIALDVIPFPTDPVEGNDDPPSNDEDADPENERTGNNLDHKVGELSSKDAPSFPVGDHWGPTGTSFDLEANFREFCRLEITDGARSTGTFWFRISAYTTWHHYLEAIKSGTTWEDTYSSAGTGHPFP